MIINLKLSNFRNHKDLVLEASPNKCNLIVGPNGSGKTNILEAISLFSPGRGLRNASSEEFFNSEINANEYAAIASFKTYEDDLRLATGSKNEFGRVGKRILKINDESLNKHSDILSYIRIIWLTPQMERIFIDSPSVRRKFLDRVTYNFFPEHAINILAYEKLARERIQLLTEGSNFDPKWVFGLEKQISELNLKIYISRKECLKMVIAELNNSSVSSFLKPNIAISGKLDEMLSNVDTNDAAFNLILQKLTESRRLDSITGRTNFGIHKSDLGATHPVKNITAGQCSTGEQKAMQISILLAQARALKKHSNVSLILLLDEIFAHLDNQARQNLLAEIEEIDCQSWISTANENLPKDLGYNDYLSL